MSPPLPQPAETGTLEVTARLLRRFLPGDTRRVLLGLALVLGASGAALLQPWPLKLVLDCVVGTNPEPAWLNSLLRWPVVGGLADGDWRTAGV